MVTLVRPPTHSSLKITNRSFRYAAPSLWNKLPSDLREPRQTQSPALSPITVTWHFIIFTIFTITACIFSYLLSVSFRTQDLALQQILSSLDLFLYYWTDYTNSRTI